MTVIIRDLLGQYTIGQIARRISLDGPSSLVTIGQISRRISLDGPRSLVTMGQIARRIRLDGPRVVGVCRFWDNNENL